MEIKFKKFQPITTSARISIQDLVSRGGTIIQEKRDYVEIKRLQSIAKVDQYGRVEWRPE